MAHYWAELLGIPVAVALILLMIVTVLIATGLRFLLVYISNRTIRSIVDGVKKRESKAQAGTANGLKVLPLNARAKQRARTMGSVINNSITWIIVIVTFMVLLQELGVSVVAIAASAGVATAVIGFGAQNVIKDILNGLFLVFEDQFGVGDQVDVGLATGTVEEVGVRITKIRDAQGVLWFVRNGEIVRVGNLSQAKKPKTT